MRFRPSGSHVATFALGVLAATGLICAAALAAGGGSLIPLRFSSIRPRYRHRPSRRRSPVRASATRSPYRCIRRPRCCPPGCSTSAKTITRPRSWTSIRAASGSATRGATPSLTRSPGEVPKNRIRSLSQKRWDRCPTGSGRATPCLRESSLNRTDFCRPSVAQIEPSTSECESRPGKLPGSGDVHRGRHPRLWNSENYRVQSGAEPEV